MKKELGEEWRLDPTHEIEYSVESFDLEMGRSGVEKNLLGNTLGGNLGGTLRSADRMKNQ